MYHYPTILGTGSSNPQRCQLDAQLIDRGIYLRIRRAVMTLY